MSTDGEFDASKVAVKTYVPAYQKEEWADHAEALDMTQSEFVRTMVQAGRRQFTVQEEPGSEDANPGGDGFEDQVLDALADSGPLPFDELAQKVVDDIEAELEAAIGTLQGENRIVHSPRRGYELVEDTG